MHQLVPTWCSDVNGLLLPSETGKRGKFASGGLKGPDLRAPAESTSLLLHVGSHCAQVVGIPSYGRHQSPCSHRGAGKLHYFRPAFRIRERMEHCSDSVTDQKMPCSEEFLWKPLVSCVGTSSSVSCLSRFAASRKTLSCFWKISLLHPSRR